MTIGGSIFLIAVGAVLRFAVNVSSSSVSIDTIGNILMIAGAIGLAVSLYLWSTASRRRVDGAVASDTVVERTRTF